jgi:hypothetical protein
MDGDEFVNEILKNAPQEWEASEGAAESIAIDYVRALEARLVAFGGDGMLYPHPEDEDGAPLPDAATKPWRFLPAAAPMVVRRVMRVKITDRVIRAALQAEDAASGFAEDQTRAGLTAALRELGFEVH